MKESTEEVSNNLQQYNENNELYTIAMMQPSFHMPNITINDALMNYMYISLDNKKIYH